MATPVALCKLCCLRGAPIEGDAPVTDRFDSRRGPSFREKEQRRLRTQRETLGHCAAQSEEEGEEDENMRAVISVRGGRGKPPRRGARGMLGKTHEQTRAEKKEGEDTSMQARSQENSSGGEREAPAHVLSIAVTTDNIHQKPHKVSIIQLSLKKILASYLQ